MHFEHLKEQREEGREKKTSLDVRKIKQKSLKVFSKTELSPPVTGAVPVVTH